MLNNDTNGLNGLKKTAKVKLIEKKWHSEVTHITPVVDQLHAGVSLELVLYFVRNKRERVQCKVWSHYCVEALQVFPSLKSTLSAAATVKRQSLFYNFILQNIVSSVNLIKMLREFSSIFLPPEHWPWLCHHCLCQESWRHLVTTYDMSQWFNTSLIKKIFHLFWIHLLTRN